MLCLGEPLRYRIGDVLEQTRHQDDLFYSNFLHFSPSRVPPTRAASSSPRLRSRPSSSSCPRRTPTRATPGPRRPAPACTASPPTAGTGWAGRPGSGARRAEEGGAAGRRRLRCGHCRENEDSVHENHSSFRRKTNEILPETMSELRTRQGSLHA